MGLERGKSVRKAAEAGHTGLGGHGEVLRLVFQLGWGASGNKW